MASADDILRTKTLDELRFYVENPSFYQSELVASARRELRRRGQGLPAAPRAAAAAPTGEEVPVAYSPPEVYPTDEEAPENRSLLLALASGAILAAVVGVSFWSRPSHQLPTAHPTPTAAAAHPLPKLVEADTGPMPYFDSRRQAAQELAALPAAERKDALKVSQFEELSRRFWQAQLPSAYLVQQADTVRAYALFANHLQAAQNEWSYLGRALVYRFDFPPTMAEHLLRMRTISESQQATLRELQAGCRAQHPLELTYETRQAQETVQRLLPGLQGGEKEAK